jgi:CrcB protein
MMPVVSASVESYGGPVTERVSDTAAGVFPVVRRRRGVRPRPGVVAVVFLGGCLGGLGRWELVATWPSGAHAFPWSVFAVNVVGAFGLALVLTLLAELVAPTTYLRPFVGTGFFGAWTTFSAVVASTDQLVAHGQPAIGVGYCAASVAGGLAAAAVGLALGRLVADRRRSTRSA